MSTVLQNENAAYLEQIETAHRKELISSGALKNIRLWLTEPCYAIYVDRIRYHINNEMWQELDDAFWTTIPFGTGGRRGKMYPIGCNAINDRTIGESVCGLANYVRSQSPEGAKLSCAIAFDTRHQSSAFSRLSAEIMVACGFHVYLLDEHRSTPELSFLVREKNCDCGLMVTASHNPPSDNAVKCYWSTGGQILPPHDKGVIDAVGDVKDIPRVDFAEAISMGWITICTDETDQRYVEEVVGQGFAGSRDLKIVYSPLHGVGATAVVPVLSADGFDDVEVFGPHATPDGDFPNVPGNVSNPENPAVFDAIIERGKEINADLVMASDPDCDRLGCAAPLTMDPGSDWKTIDGNQIGALLTHFVLKRRHEAGTLSDEHFVVKTLVTTELVRRIAESYGVRLVGDLLVGFKWIGGAMDDHGPEKFVLGTEESHGYLVGQYARDKDGAVSAMLLAELAAQAKSEGKTLHQVLDEIYLTFGCHRERLITQTMSGSAGMAKMNALMQQFRETPPESLGDLSLLAIRDFQNNEIRYVDGTRISLKGPVGNLVFFELEEKGNYIAARPSGTEPKIKFYLFTFVDPSNIDEVDSVKDQLDRRLDMFQADLEKIVSA